VTPTSTVCEEAHIVVQYLWQKIVDSLIGIGGKNSGKVDEELMKQNQSAIDSFFITLAMSLNSRSIPAAARDSILQIFIKNIGKIFYTQFTTNISNQKEKKMAEILIYENFFQITMSSRGAISFLKLVR